MARGRRFLGYGELIEIEDVPAMVRNGHMIWSFGYGSNDDDFTTIDESDLWRWESDIIGVAREWGPFRHHAFLCISGH